MAGLLTAWAMNFGVWHMMALYMGPLAVTNCWLVMYTWLQHTDVSHCLNSVYEMSAQLINLTFAQLLLPCFHTQKGTRSNPLPFFEESRGIADVRKCRVLRSFAQRVARGLQEGCKRVGYLSTSKLDILAPARGIRRLHFA